jgi:hypothetical protein
VAATRSERWRPPKLPRVSKSGRLVVGEHLRVRGVEEEIGDRHWLVARRARSTRADAAAEATALQAILLTEIAGRTRWACIDGAWPRGSRWDRWKRSWVTTTPRRLAARRGAEALSANSVERTPAHRADHRRSAIVTRPELRLHDLPHVPWPAGPRPCQTWPEPGGRCLQR